MRKGVPLQTYPPPELLALPHKGNYFYLFKEELKFGISSVVAYSWWLSVCAADGKLHYKVKSQPQLWEYPQKLHCQTAPSHSLYSLSTLPMWNITNKLQKSKSELTAHPCTVYLYWIPEVITKTPKDPEGVLSSLHFWYWRQWYHGAQPAARSDQDSLVVIICAITV